MTPKSLKAKLLLGISYCLLLLVVGGGVGGYVFFRGHVYEEFDHALYDKIRFLRAACVLEEGEVRFDLTETVWSRVQDDHDPEYFQIWGPGGKTLHRSWEAPAGDLPDVAAGSREPVYGDLVLPSGLEGRVAGQSFVPGRIQGDTEAFLVTVAVAHDTERITAGLAELRRLIWIWGLVSGAIVLAAAWSIVVRNLRPLLELSDQIEKIPIGAEGGRFDLANAPEEIDPVVERLNAMMDRVEGALENERQFTANAAHELRNPLAGMRSRLELALSKSREPEQYRDALGTVLGIEIRLESMVENLLLLTRLQAGSDVFAKTEVSVPEILRSGWKPFFDEAEAKGITVTLECDDEVNSIVSSRDLLEMLLRNLFDNAVTYTEEGGQIQIRADRSAKRLKLLVANTNPGLGEEEIEKMFGRFWRASAAREGDHLHAGIGLTLVQRISEALGGTVGARLSEEGMIEIGVSLPDENST